MTKFASVAAALALAACAHQYVPPTTTAAPLELEVQASRAELFRAAQRVLVEQGFAIRSADEAAGVVSTAPRTMRLTPELADCGQAMGLDYLKDVRTVTRVSLGVIASDGRVRATSGIDGEYKGGGYGIHDVTLTCQSRGQLERDLLLRIRENAALK